MSIVLDGSTQYINLGNGVNVISARPYTYAALVNCDLIRATGSWNALFCQGDYSGSGWGVEIEAATAANRNLYHTWTGPLGLHENYSTWTIPAASGWWLFMVVHRISGGGSAVDFYGYRYATRVLSQGTAGGGGTANEDPSAPGGSDPTEIGAFNDGAVIDHFRGQLGWSAIFAGDLGEAGATNPKALWELIWYGPWRMRSPSMRLFMPHSIGMAAKDLSGYNAQGTLVATPSWYPPALTEAPPNTSRFWPVWEVSGGGAGGISGTLSQSIGDIVQSAAATLLIAGASTVSIGEIAQTSASTLALTGASTADIGAITQSAAGALLVVGASAADVGAITQSAAGTAALAGTLAQSIGDITQSAAATVAIAGASAASVGEITLSATGAVALAGAASQDIGAVTLGGTGAVLITGALSQSIGEITQSAASVIGNTPISGELAQSIGDVTQSAAGTVLIAGASAANVGAVTLSATGALPVYGAQSASIGEVVIAAAGVVYIAGAGAQDIGAISVTATGALTITGVLGADVGAITLTAAGYSGDLIDGTLAPALRDQLTAAAADQALGLDMRQTTPAGETQLRAVNRRQVKA